MVTIIPAILATTKEEFSEQLEKIKSSSSLAEGWVHLDVMDGQLVENTSISVSTIETFDIPFQKEAHLMVKNPQEYINDLKRAGFKRVIIHIESQAVKETIGLIKNLSMEVGIAINPETDLNEIADLSGEVDEIMVMGIHPGQQGQTFLLNSYDRVKLVKKMTDNVAVDGGVNIDTISRLIESGASRLIMGSYLQKGDIDENLEKIWEIIG
jgi:ribulose-phosphate 3-epimerase